jgi:hypothetical protein
LCIFRSFVPKSSVIQSVAVYPSEFGVKAMAEEKEKGPQGLWDDNEKAKLKKMEEKDAAKAAKRAQGDYDSDDDSDIDLWDGALKKEDKPLDTEKLRRYELQKLKYVRSYLQYHFEELSHFIV